MLMYMFLEFDMSSDNFDESQRICNFSEREEVVHGTLVPFNRFLLNILA
jgi:hypothetical protein